MDMNIWMRKENRTDTNMDYLDDPDDLYYLDDEDENDGKDTKE